MTLPDWNFGGDEEKRSAFIRWVNVELDRFAGLTGNYDDESEPDCGWGEYLAGASREAHRPPNPATGMNELVWEYALLRYMFNRYWPGKRRPSDDPAHAANIVVERSRGLLPADHRRVAARAVRAELRQRLLDEWERREPSERLESNKRPAPNKGREQAARDIAILSALPPALFEK